MKHRLVVMTSDLIVLAGCNDPVGEAEARYAFLKENKATLGEVGDAARAVRDAYADQGDSEAFQHAQAWAEIDCSEAQMQGGNMPYGIEPTGSDGETAMK